MTHTTLEVVGTFNPHDNQPLDAYIPPTLTQAEAIEAAIETIAVRSLQRPGIPEEFVDLFLPQASETKD